MNNKKYSFRSISLKECKKCVADGKNAYLKAKIVPYFECGIDVEKETEFQNKIGAVGKVTQLGLDRNGDWNLFSVYYDEEGNEMPEGGNGGVFCPPFCE